MAANSLVFLILILAFKQPDKQRSMAALLFAVPTAIAMALSSDTAISYFYEPASSFLDGGLFLYISEMGGYYVFHAMADTLIMLLLVNRVAASKYVVYLFLISTAFFVTNFVGILLFIDYHEPLRYEQISIALYTITAFILIDRRSIRERLGRMASKCGSIFTNGNKSHSVIQKNEEKLP